MSLLALLIQMPSLPAWDVMPPLRLRQERRVSPASHQFVGGEVARGRCGKPPPAPRLAVDVALLVTPRDTVVASVPRAIACPTIEQYAAGLAISWARGNLAPRAPRIGWYRVRVEFDWTR